MFKNKEYLADGTYGIVYQIEYEGILACLKEYRMPIDKNGVSDDILKEIFHSTHPYAKISIHYVSTDFKNIIMDLFDGDLYFLQKDHNLKDIIPYFTTISSQILEQLYILHSYGFLHSDIKLGNILLNKSKNIFALCDFGLCEYYGFPSIKKKYICTEFFKAPNIGIRNNINFDIYSLGATLYYLSGKKYITTIEKRTISNQTIYDLINYRHNFSAKKLLNIDNKYDKKLKYIKNIISRLDLREEEADSNKIIDCVFLNLTIKNSMYNIYTFDNMKCYELEYLDDTFNIYINNPFYFGNNDNITNKYNISNKLLLLKQHNTQSTHLDTLLFSWYLLDNVPFLGSIDNIDESIIYFNFSCKLLEFNKICQVDILNNYIIEIEYNLINKFLKKELIFTPSVFYIYYFLFKLAYLYPNQYYLEYRILESIVLGMYILYILRPIKYDRNMTYAKLSYKIILASIDFLLNKKIEEKLDKILKGTVRLLDSDSLSVIIENNELKNYLTLNHTL